MSGTTYSRRLFLGQSAAVAAGVVSGGSLLAACGESTTSQASGTVEIGTLYETGSPYYAAYQRAVDKVEQQYSDLNIDLVFANTEARPKLQLRWKNGDPPDVDYVYNSGDPSSLHYVTEGKLLDLTSRMEQTDWGDGKSWAEAMLPSFRHFAQHDGKFYMAPESAAVIAVYYNAKLFKQLNLSPPQTWPELLATANTIRGQGVSPIAVTGTFEPYMGFWWDYLLLRELGPEPVMDVAWGEAKLADDPRFLSAARKLHELVAAKPFLDGFSAIDFTAAQAAFFQGKAAMILMGSWLQGEMKEAIPEDFELAVAPFPAIEGGAGDPKGLFGTLIGESVWSKTQHPDACVDYLRFSDAKDEQARRVEELGIVSPYAGVPGPPGVGGMAELLAAATTSPVTHYYYGVSQDEKLKNAWYGPVAKLFLEGSSPEQMVQEIDANLARAR